MSPAASVMGTEEGNEPMRSGVIAQKVGMTRIYTTPASTSRDGAPHGELPGRGQRTQEKNGYTAVQLGAGTQGEEHSKALRGHFAAAKVEPKRRSPSSASPRQPARRRRRDHRDHFVAGQLVDVTGTSIGKGFPAR
jgi:large subunit ribosomal protein L3